MKPKCQTEAGAEVPTAEGVHVVPHAAVPNVVLHSAVDVEAVRGSNGGTLKEALRATKAEWYAV